MQNNNPVIKNYILSEEKRIIGDEALFCTTDILKYHEPLEQNKVFLYFVLSKRY